MPVFQSAFETLDPEMMNNTTLRYSKSVLQLEKGLPPNAVVPKLKERVELMRERVSDTPEHDSLFCCHYFQLGAVTGVAEWLKNLLVMPKAQV